jgi:hypothetical protein
MSNRKIKGIVKVPRSRVLAITGLSAGRLSQIKDQLPPLSERANVRGGGTLYDLRVVRAWARLHPPDKAKQRAGRARHSRAGAVPTDTTI